MNVNYSEEVKRLNAFVPGSNNKFWKPKNSGQYRVKALSELEEADPFKKEGEADKPQAKIEMLVGESSEKVVWTIGKGSSPASAYGQLVRLAAKKGKLKDLEFLIVVTFDGKKNTYTIVEL
jgi:hypothetical protein